VNENELDQERHWERVWDGHELAQMRRLARLPLSEKLLWLEEAQRLVDQLRQQNQKSAQIRS
jgi:hypothetical protein